MGTPSTDALAIVVCLWNRPERLAEVLRIVDSQHTTRRLRLVLWNNDARNLEYYRSVIAGFTPLAALDSVEFVNSPTNIGGMGRFVAARELVARGYTGHFIMMDDDQNFTPSFVEDLLAVAHPGSFAGVWAWTNSGAYWNRSQLETTGAPADHVGTGGSICDSALVTDERFFTAIPTRFLFMEDIWMSHYVQRNGGRLTMVSSPFEFTMSELDQGHALFPYKEEFYRWLQRPAHIPRAPGNGQTSRHG
ncbi:glycosyltransferase family 2 protein [Parafrigoribacterium soli]|uniref:glycosyltransferase family 2 protein n=1 Tax=Parafrigoribacterium soli TaxID=3144663 RepID=UPI0032EC3581